MCGMCALCLYFKINQIFGVHFGAQTAVARLVNVQLKYQETFMFRAALLPNLGNGANCQQYCEILREAAIFLGPLVNATITTAYMGCWKGGNEAKNLENLEGLIKGNKNTKFDCHRDSDCKIMRHCFQ